MLGKRIWLVGASEGIGEMLAKKLALAGHTLVLSARNEEKLQSIVATLHGGNHEAIALDVADDASVEAAWKLQHTPPDLLIYNAGVYEPMAADAMTLETIERMVNINFSGALRVLSRVIPAMVARKSGHIALVGSVAGYTGLPAAMGYGASKAAMIHLAENLACDLHKHHIKVQIINPGFVKTRLTDKNDFKMPGLITAEQAADYIMAGLESKRFEIRFPWAFSGFLKLLRIVPYRLYFALIRSVKW